MAGFGIVALLCASVSSRAQDLVINSFDDDGGGNFQMAWRNFRSYVYGVT
jgi:hypothetical protein